MSRAAVIIASVAGAARLPKLLESLAVGGQAPPPTIVVDNGSPDGAVAAACERFEFVDCVHLAGNVGFARAINRAARLASAETIVLLNDDCVCDPGFVEHIVERLDIARGLVMSAGVLRGTGPAPLIDTAGIEIDHTLLAFDYLNGEPLAALEGELADPLGPCAAAAAYDRASFLDVGGFDESLFAYWEDVDLALRLRVAGGRCALAVAAQGVHDHSGTLGSGSPRKDYLMGFGRGYVLKKWGVLTPRRIPAILARDLPICIGQLVFDRTAAGIRGRVSGLRAARHRRTYPADTVAAAPSSKLWATLRRRRARRRRARGSITGAPDRPDPTG